MKVNFLYMLVAMAVGFFVVYILAPSPKIVMKHPKLSNIENTLFVDENKVCYKYVAEETQCDK